MYNNLYSSITTKTKTNPDFVKLPSITTQLNCCLSCNIHKNHGCSNTIRKNGSKIWYVLHNLIESIPTKIINKEEFEIMCITILSILKSLPCKECADYSIAWYNLSVINNKKLYEKSYFLYELWKHHDDVNKHISIMNPCIIPKRLSWNEYKQQVEINKITCTQFR